MTFEPEKSPDNAVDVVELAERQLDMALALLSDAIMRKAERSTGEDLDGHGATLEVLAALRMLFVLRARIDDDRHDGISGAAALAIDLEVARTEIGGLLDRLRAEGSAEQVPERDRAQ